MTPEKDHRHGHRGRLRARLLKAGREAFADYELLELLLTYAIPRKDTKALAKSLVGRFGSFAAVLDQPRERLLEVEYVGPQTVTFLLVIRSAMARYFEQGAKAFRGELVLQDPKDEPAEKLMERIRAKRYKPSAAPVKRRKIS